MGTVADLAMRCGIAEGAVKEALEALRRGDVAAARTVLEFARLVALKECDDPRAKLARALVESMGAGHDS